MTTTGSTGTTVRRDVATATVVGIVVVAAWLAVVVGVVAGVRGVLDGAAAVPVAMGPSAPAWSEVVVPCVEGDGCEPSVSADVWPSGEPLPAQPSGPLRLWVLDADPLTAALAGVPDWLGLVTGGVVTLLLLPVLRATAAGRPFAAGGARRLTVAAAVVAGAWLLALALPALAGPRVVALSEQAPLSDGVRTWDLPSGWLVPDVHVTWWPLLVTLLLGALAAAAARGARLAANTEGLV
ncbi:hypothetical protein [Cellulomonas sp.]|uniref:hypothetical protein n=1 Tax=Cellulomonas sp. TaxID=40001 RepID=UPI001B1950D2|nr:hypothetical protein [Cellulomonas sp.]MBO9553476.1 hypothetical protein [Cellulomonas sp.]